MVEHTAYIGLGSNRGDRHRYLCRAVEKLADHAAVRVIRTSSVYRTQAHRRGPEDSSAPFLNAVVEIGTSLSPEQLLDLLQAIEVDAGRRPTNSDRWEARTLDLDLLIYDRLTRRGSRLVLPHPRLDERRFVLEPLVEIDGGIQVPAPLGQTVAELLEQCTDPYTLEKTELPLVARP